MVINGKLAHVDLTSGDVAVVQLDKGLFKDFIGGAGLAARLLAPVLDCDVQPLDPGNPLIFVPGVLAGTKAPNCGRHVVCARSPLTGIWGESNSGGMWGAELKLAGWDGLLVTGKASKPSAIIIEDDDIKVIDATPAWGKTTRETEAWLEAETGVKKLRISSIGPAGEHLVKYACIINDGGRAAGRTGMGAVMGSKQLKAIGVKGSGKLVPVDEEAFDSAKAQLLEEIGENFTNNMFSELGTAGYIDMAALTGDLSFKYFTQGSWDGAYDISGSTMSETILKKRNFCRQCTIGCGRVVAVEGDSKYATGGEVDGPEYETLGSFGAALLCKDLAGIAAANLLCNDLGVDTISCGVSIAFAYHLQEKGLLPPEKAAGLVLEWGNIDPALELIKLITYRKDIGDILAEGVSGAASMLGVDAGEAAAVHGLEVPFHEPRAYFGSALEYITSHRGACHQTAQFYLTSMGAPFPDVNIECIDRFENEGVGECVALLQDLRAVYQSLSMCNFIVPSSVDLVATLFSAGTGIPYTKEDVMQAGERINTLRRVLNLNLGYDASCERLPSILMQPLDGGTEGKLPDVTRQRADWYEHRKWDAGTGEPGAANVKRLGLEDLPDLI